jgi:hypothetical protein
MELAWPRLANEETATAIAVDKDTRTKVTTTSTVDREQIFRCMTRPQGSRLELFNVRRHNGFSMI